MPETARMEIEFAGRPLSDVIKEVEAHYLSHIMTETGGNKTHAAKRAGLTLETLRRKLKCYTVKAIYRLE